jgi:hypothetical protein
MQKIVNYYAIRSTGLVCAPVKDTIEAVPSKRTQQTSRQTQQIKFSVSFFQ